MEDTLITFPTAKLAKEKGFNISSRSDGIGTDVFINGKLTHTIFYDKNHIHAPTQSLLQRWLREVHKKHINVQPFYYKGDFISWNLKIHNTYYKDKFNTYEEALEQGLFEALKLIK